jgi:DNA-binding response OmpR family regulator
LILEPEFRVLVADGGRMALRILGQEPVSVMTLDLRMPGLSGSETLLELREVNADVEVVIVTGFGTYSEALRALRLQAFELISKPFDASRVRDAVRQAVARRELRLRSPISDRGGLPKQLFDAIREFERAAVQKPAESEPAAGPAVSERSRPFIHRQSRNSGFDSDGDDQQQLFAENVILPEQLQNATSRIHSSEFALLWALFIDGIQTYCYEIYVGTTTSLAYREVERWIFRPSSDAITSFSTLCELFGADAARLRRALLLFREHPNPAILELLNLRAA